MAIINDSKTFIPVLYDSANSTVNGTDNTNPPSNGLTEATSTTRAAFSSFTTANSTTRFYYKFDCSSVPQNATINSVTCDFKATCSSSYFNTRIGQLCYGTTKKGTAVTITNSSINDTVNVQTITDGGSWTREELNDIGIVVEAIRGTSTNAFTLSFYGATLTVNYTYDNTTYQITSISNTDLVDSIEPEGVTDVLSGETYTLNVYADTFGDFIVEDNGVDVTNQLIQRENITSGTVESYPVSYTTTGSISGTKYQSAIGKSVENPSTQTGNDYCSNSGSEANIDYSFDFSSIPENVIIDNVSVVVRGHLESTSNANEKAEIQLYSNSVAKGSSVSFTSTSNQNVTVSDVGTWNRTELQGAKLRFTIGYYGGLIVGVTWKVSYSTPSTSQYYWEYTLSNVSADHTIYVTEAVVIPPDEDPTITYYPITISSINATTTPGKGTARVESGTSETITITPSDPQLTLALDNGVDITSQLVAHGGTIPDPTIATAPGASYGFNFNSSTGYYVSTNNGLASSASVARVSFDLPVRCLVTIQYINYAEANYDFSVFGKVDTTLSTTGWTSSQSGGDTTTDSGLEQLRCNTSSYNSSNTQTLTYEIPAGSHYIDVKYGKDQASDANNDSLQWKITNIEPLESVVGYYTYTLSNINQEHSLIFIFGDVTYYFVNSSTNSDCRLYPNGQMVQLPGDSYRLTIAPKNSGDTITLRDNNVDVTSQLERKEVTTEKDGQTITVVNYIYRLSDIQATHNLVVSSSSQGLTSSIKLNGQWDYGELKRKQDDRWGTLSYTRIWVHNGSAWIENAQRTITTNGMIFGGVISNGGGE